MAPSGSAPASGRVSSRTSTAVEAGDVTLQAYTHRRPGLPADAPTVVAVHGYPDTALVWDPVVAALGVDHAVVTYDVRGAGGSSAPGRLDGYRTERLVDDLVAVLDALVPDRVPVHLLGHDWGSVQLWEAVCAADDSGGAADPRLVGRMASYTSISGPCLAHTAAFLREAPGDQVRRQRRRSWYVAAFHVPVLPELAWRHLTEPARRGLARREGLVDRDGARGHWAATLGEDGARGLGLYRANVRRHLRSSGNGRTRVPVQLLVPRHDRFLTAAAQTHAARMVPQPVPQLVQVEVEAGHWVHRTRPALVADLVRRFAASHPGGPKDPT